MNKNFITLTGDTGGHCLDCSSPRHASIDVVGEGAESYAFPDTDTLVRRALERARKIEPGDSDDPAIRFHRMRPGLDDDIWEIIRPVRVIPEKDFPLGQTLVSGAEGLQKIMADRQFDGLIYARFGSLIGAVTWAEARMDAKYQPAIASLRLHLTQLTEQYKQALPEVIKQLAEQNAGVPLQVLLQHALQLLDKELAPVLRILQVYTDSFGQHRDGVYRTELELISFFYHQAYLLFQKLDPSEDESGFNPQLPTQAFQVGDVFLARFTAMGLATIPGSRGPIGAHALQVPFDMLDILTLQLPLLAHEFRHNIFHDVPGLEQELISAVNAAIEDAGIDWTSAKIRLGNQKLPTLELMQRLITDTIGEIDADIAGGVLLNGPSYLYNMLMSFPALLMREGVRKSTKILRTSSAYQFVPLEGGGRALRFEPHPPDYIRAHIVAAALDTIGYSDEAQQCRELADFAVGDPKPEFITWTDGEGKSKVVVKIPVADIKAVAPVIADALINTSLESLGGRSTGDLINWAPRREATVQKLARQLAEGKSEIPADAGSVFATYVGSAATVAYWKLVNDGTEAVEAARLVNKAAIAMLIKLRKRFED